MDHALRYAWLVAKAYDYETSLSPGHPANAATMLEDLVRVRQLGQWDEDTPMIGNGGLAEVLAKLKANYDVLEGQLGLNNSIYDSTILSLRTEGMRIRPPGTSTSSDQCSRPRNPRTVTRSPGTGVMKVIGTVGRRISVSAV